MPDHTAEKELKLPPLPDSPAAHILGTQGGELSWVPVRSTKIAEVDDDGTEWSDVIIPTE